MHNDQQSVHVTEQNGSRAARVPVPIPSNGDTPDVEVMKDGEVVTSIRMSCPCGRTVDIVCEYDDPSANT